MEYKVEVEKSKVHGLGIIAQEKIPKGSLIWSLEKLRGHVEVPVEEFENYLRALPTLQDQKELLMYTYCVNGICYDNRKTIVKYWNHSQTPNCTPVNPQTGELNIDYCFASRDIEVGEEIFDDYREYDYPEVLTKLHLEILGFSKLAEARKWK